jgi:predicted Zn-dependent peptidase
MYQKLVKEQKLFTDIGAYMMGELDESLFVVEGKLVNGTSIETAEKAIFDILETAKTDVSEAELTKVKNKALASLVFSEMSIGNKALNLAYYEMLGNADLANQQENLYNSVSCDQIKSIAKRILVKSNCSILRYQANQNA